MAKPSRKRVVIFGAGYAGLVAALSLGRNRAVRGGAEIILVDRNSRHLLQTELHAVAAGLLSPSLAALNIRGLLRGSGVEFLQAEVMEVDTGRGRLETSRMSLTFDFLVAAPGSATNTFGISGMDRHAAGLKTLDDAIAVRNRIAGLISAFRADTSRRPEIIVVGAGPTGVELAAYIRERLARAGFPACDGPRVTLLEAAPSVLPGSSLTRRMKARAAGHLEESGLRLITGRRVDRAEKERLHLSGGGSLAFDLLVWTGGVRAADIAGSLPAERGAMSRVHVTPELSLDGFPNIYVLGDAAFVEYGAKRRLLPCAAQFATRQAGTAAANIAAQITGRGARAAYVPEILGEFVSLGGGTAVAWAGPLQFFGPDAQAMKKAILAKYLLQIGVNPAEWLAKEAF